jgi:CspA family cold shock protein
VSALSGTVVAFDREVGLGDVRADDGTMFGFHCVEIADGSRDIEVGSAVTFEVMSKFGRYEAARVTRR